MSERGFVVNTADMAGIVDSYDLTKIVKLTGVDVPRTAAAPTIADSRARKLPQDFYADSIEGHVDVTGGAPTSIFAKLCWDSTGDHYFTNEVEITLAPGLTDTSLRSFSADIDVFRVQPSKVPADAFFTGTETGSCWIMLKTGQVGSTVTLKRLQLYWRREAR